MIDIRSFYQFGYFLPHGLAVSPEATARLFKVLLPLGMIPATAPAIQIGIEGIRQMTKIQNLQFISNDKGITITFEPGRYLIQMNNKPKVHLPEFSMFESLSNEIIRALEQDIRIKAHRMSFVSRGLCKKLKSETLSNIHSKLFTLPEIFEKWEPVEWSNRQVYRVTKEINKKNELLNIVLDFNRIKTQLNIDNKISDYEGIEMGFDINTFQGNASQRFSIEDVVPFLDEAWEICSNLENSFEEMFLK